MTLILVVVEASGIDDDAHRASFEHLGVVVEQLVQCLELLFLLFCH